VIIRFQPNTDFVLDHCRLIRPGWCGRATCCRPSVLQPFYWPRV